MNIYMSYSSKMVNSYIHEQTYIFETIWKLCLKGLNRIYVRKRILLVL
jgi:hypothetical protein